VPPAFTQQGYTREIVTQQLAQGVGEIDAAAASARGSALPEQEREAKTIEVLEDYFRVRQVVNLARDWVNTVPNRISGEVLDRGSGRFEFRLRVVRPGASTVESSRTLPSEGIASVDDLIRWTAYDALRAIDPYTIAVYHYREELRQVPPRFPRTYEALRHTMSVLPSSEHAWPYNLWGRALVWEGRHEEARQLLERSAATQPGFARPIMNIGISFTEQGRYSEAYEAYARALRIDPRYVPVYEEWGKSLARENRVSEAEMAFQRGLMLDPSSPGLLIGLGDLMRSTGRHAEAFAVYDRIVASDGGRSTAAHNRRREMIPQLLGPQTVGAR
jgi:tetratricopeptide (TPR) repeat protein